MATGTISGGVENGSTNEPLELDDPNLALHMTLAAFTAIAWYNVVELNLSVYMTFKRKRGLYFWSVFASIWGIALHSVAFILKLYGVVTTYQVTVTMITIGWYAMVTGQSLVLYSRLHLIVQEPKIIRAVLIMIIFNAITMHFPTTVLTYGSNSPDWRQFIAGFRIMEKLQMTMFCVQELIISGIYIWATIRFLRPVYRRHIRSVMLQLLWINVAIIFMDIGMLTMEYLNKYFLEAVMKGAIYSVKLKLEFAVLNQLMQIARSSRNQAIMPGDSQKSSNRRASSAAGGRGFRGFIRKFIPGPIPNAVEEPNNAYFISPSILQSTHSTRHHQQQRNVTGRYEGAHGPEPPQHGIAMTTEITQEISAPEDHTEPSRDDLDKATFFHAENRTRNPSLKLGDSMRSDKTGHSQMELFDYPSSEEVGKMRRNNFDRHLPAPQPTAGPWNSRSSSVVLPPSSQEAGPVSRMVSSTRPSVSNLKGGTDGESRASDEVRLNGD